jgi:hypothetical protein
MESNERQRCQSHCQTEVTDRRQCPAKVVTMAVQMVGHRLCQMAEVADRRQSPAKAVTIAEYGHSLVAHDLNPSCGGIPCQGDDRCCRDLSNVPVTTANSDTRSPSIAPWCFDGLD